MDCPNCDTPRMLTTETFSMPTETIRTKKCRECAWTFTSREEISDELGIPRSVRKMKRERVATCESATS